MLQDCTPIRSNQQCIDALVTVEVIHGITMVLRIKVRLADVSECKEHGVGSFVAQHVYKQRADEQPGGNSDGNLHHAETEA